MGTSKDSNKQSGTCPYKRVIHRSKQRFYIGNLLEREFNLIDRMMLEELAMDNNQLSLIMGISEDTIARYTRYATSAGLLGHIVEHEVRHSLVPTYGLTMKATKIWHECLGEEWDKDYYEGRPWIFDPSIHPRRTSETAESPRTKRRLEMRDAAWSQAERDYLDDVG